MAAGLGFKDFTTGEVLTANDVDGYLMQGVWVFASASARNSAVTSPQEGNMSYLKDTNSVEYYSGSAWVAVGGAAAAAALTQIVPTSTTVSGGSASISASGAVTFTGCTSMSVNGAFTSTYTNYLIITDSISANTQTDIYFRLRASGSDTTSNYNIMLWTKPFASGSSNPVSLGNTSMGTSNLYMGDGNSTSNFYNQIWVSSPNIASKTSVNAALTSEGTYSTVGGYQTDSTQFDGFTFYTTTNNITGKVRVYGYAK